MSPKSKAWLLTSPGSDAVVNTLRGSSTFSAYPTVRIYYEIR